MITNPILFVNELNSIDFIINYCNNTQLSPEFYKLSSVAELSIQYIPRVKTRKSKYLNSQFFKKAEVDTVGFLDIIVGTTPI